MITRAQAEALLTLAESLEACTELGIQIQEDDEGVCVLIGDRPWFSEAGEVINGITIRLAVNALIPKQET